MRHILLPLSFQLHFQKKEPLKYPVAVFVLMVILLTACTTVPVVLTQTPSPVIFTKTSTATIIPATPTETSTPTPTVTMTPAVPVGMETAVPVPSEAISLKNSENLTQLACWGKAPIKKMLFSKETNVLITIDLCGTGRVYDADTIKLKYSIHPGGQISGLGMMPDGKTILTANTDGQYNFIDLEDGAAGRTQNGRIHIVRRGKKGFINE